jgi:AraC-like DNA-binding protein
MPRSDEKLSEIALPRLPDAVRFGEVVYQPGATLGPRVQQHVQLVVIHSGEARIYINDQSHRLGPNEICLLRHGATEWFEFDRTGRTHHSWLDLHYQPMPRRLGKLVRSLPFSGAMTRRLQGLLDAGLSICRMDHSINELTLRHLGAAMFQAYANSAMRGRERPLPRPVEAARRFVHENLAKPVDLADIASAASVTESHLIRLFRQHLMITPARYLWQVRTHRGVELLYGTGLSISEIAYQCGFATPFHFSRLVKQHLGQSPRQLRQQHWSGHEVGD